MEGDYYCVNELFETMGRRFRAVVGKPAARGVIAAWPVMWTAAVIKNHPSFRLHERDRATCMCIACPGPHASTGEGLVGEGAVKGEQNN